MHEPHYYDWPKVYVHMVITIIGTEEQFCVLFYIIIMQYLARLF